MRRRARSEARPGVLTRTFGAAALLLALSSCASPWDGLIPVESDPVQTDFETFPSWEHRGAMLEAVAEYELEGVVLSTRAYRLARMGRVAPLDVAIGWGPMSHREVLEQLDISQRYRWYIYNWRNPPPIAPAEMQAHSANVHVVPASSSIRRQLFSLSPGDRVRMTGRLVNLRDDRGEMRTSRSRTDRGAGSCEILYVEEVSPL